MLRLAIQKSGRLTRGALDLLKRGGFEFEEKSTGLINPCKNFPIELLLLRDEDIPESVAAGAADLGIVGSNVLED
jgi:ATP phosphoribosyltransferase